MFGGTRALRRVADTTAYTYDAGEHDGGHYRETFRRENTIVDDRMIESIKGPKRLLARLAGFRVANQHVDREQR